MSLRGVCHAVAAVPRLFSFLVVLSGSAIADDCPGRGSSGAINATISRVTDGDSLVLANSDRVRIIGINAPELYHRNKREQPFASTAKEYAAELLGLSSSGHRPTVTLIPGREPSDEHGRSLYHVILEDGRSLAEELVRAGLAVQSAVFPNTRCASAYAQVEVTARDQRMGLWRKPDFWLRKQTKLPKPGKGFHIIQDRVDKHAVRRGKKGVTHQLTLDNGARLFVPTEQSRAFSDAYPSVLTGKMVEIRGWFYHFRRRSTVNLHHPANLRVLD